MDRTAAATAAAAGATTAAFAIQGISPQSYDSNPLYRNRINVVLRNMAVSAGAQGTFKLLGTYVTKEARKQLRRHTKLSAKLREISAGPVRSTPKENTLAAKIEACKKALDEAPRVVLAVADGSGADLARFYDWLAKEAATRSRDDPLNNYAPLEITSHRMDEFTSDFS